MEKAVFNKRHNNGKKQIVFALFDARRCRFVCSLAGTHLRCRQAVKDAKRLFLSNGCDSSFLKGHKHTIISYKFVLSLRRYCEHCICLTVVFCMGECIESQECCHADPHCVVGVKEPIG
jgi:hypothetical protein